VEVRFKFSPPKAQAVIAYLAQKNVPSLDVYKICKLVFLADKLHLVQFGRPITGDDYAALVDGPVPSEIYDLLKPGRKGNDEFVAVFLIDTRYKYPRYSLRADAEINFELLSKSDRQVLDEVVRRHGAKDFNELKILTHEMPEWKKAWTDRRADWQGSYPMYFEEFFEEDSDALTGTLEIVIENAGIANAFARRPN